MPQVPHWWAKIHFLIFSKRWRVSDGSFGCLKTSIDFILATHYCIHFSMVLISVGSMHEFHFDTQKKKYIRLIWPWFYLEEIESKNPSHSERKKIEFLRHCFSLNSAWAENACTKNSPNGVSDKVGWNVAPCFPQDFLATKSRWAAQDTAFHGIVTTLLIFEPRKGEATCYAAVSGLQ